MRFFASLILMSHEKIEVVDPETGHPTGLCLPRHEVLSNQSWCRSTNVYVLNSHGQVLCHQRSLGKERLPGVWSTHLGGHLVEGEDYATNARKELFEESGISKHDREIIHWRTLRAEHTPSSQNVRLWIGEYVTLFDGDTTELVPQPGEVEQFKWMTPDEVLTSAKEDPKMWCAGTQDFRVEYACMRAAVTAAQSMGMVQPQKAMHVWAQLGV
jgi:isopentenyldiphosphate isomerase